MLMKGFLTKDYYLLKKTFPILFITEIIIGCFISLITSEYVVVIIVSAMTSMVEISTINIEKNVSWNKLAVTMVENRKGIVTSKYLMYLALDVLGALIGSIAVFAIMIRQGGISIENLGGSFLDSCFITFNSW